MISMYSYKSVEFYMQGHDKSMLGFCQSGTDLEITDYSRGHSHHRAMSRLTHHHRLS